MMQRDRKSEAMERRPRKSSRQNVKYNLIVEDIVVNYNIDHDTVGKAEIVNDQLKRKLPTDETEWDNLSFHLPYPRRVKLKTCDETVPLAVFDDIDSPMTDDYDKMSGNVLPGWEITEHVECSNLSCDMSNDVVTIVTINELIELDTQSEYGVETEEESCNEEDSKSDDPSDSSPIPRLIDDYGKEIDTETCEEEKKDFKRNCSLYACPGCWRVEHCSPENLMRLKSVNQLYGGCIKKSEELKLSRCFKCRSKVRRKY